MSFALPALRQELEILPGPESANGDPSWIIHDPIRNAYFNIGWLEHAFLSRWHFKRADRVIDHVLSTTTLDADLQDLEHFVAFLVQSECCSGETDAEIAQLERNLESRETRLGKTRFQRQLFRRFPLVHPDRFLDKTMPVVRGLYHPAWKWCCLVLAGVAGYLVFREWQLFKADFVAMFSWQYLPLLFLVLAITKCIHELGHAYACKRYGLTVPTMGVAVFVIWPFLYTDTTAAWRLTERRQRVGVGMAGVVAECYTAVFCIVAWVLLSPGPLRSTVLFIGTVSLMTTLLINVNPFMRWDGYYVLSDACGIDNMQSRAFVLGRWYLRRLVLGFDEPLPDRFTTKTLFWMIVYAYMTWLYRLVLFASLAYLAYLFLFKAVGIVAFALALYWFVGKPMLSEFIYIMSHRDKMSWNRHSLSTVALLASACTLALIPFDTVVSVKGQITYGQRTTLYSPDKAKIVRVYVDEGQRVMKGDRLFVLASPQYEYRLQKAALAETNYSALLARLGDRKTLDEKDVINSRLKQVQRERLGVERQRKRLTIEAANDGLVTRLSDYAREGAWVAEDTALGIVISDQSQELIAYLTQQDLGRVAVGRKGKFIPEDPALASIAVELVDIDRTAVADVDVPGLAAMHGGDVVVRDRGGEQLVPLVPVYRLRFRLLGSSPDGRARAALPSVRGTVHIEATPVALSQLVRERITGLLVRESGF